MNENSDAEVATRHRAAKDPLLHLRMPDQLREAVDAYAGSLAKPISRSQAIRTILSDWLSAQGFIS